MSKGMSLIQSLYEYLHIKKIVGESGTVSVYCSWCDGHISGPTVEDHANGPEDVSHGMCTECAEKEIEKDECKKIKDC